MVSSLAREVGYNMGTWDNIKTWEFVLPPSRPSVRNLQLIRDKISEIDKQAPIAILGCTPEFRDLLHELKFVNIFLLDKNIDMYHQMSALRAHNNDENIVLGDWLDVLPKHKNKFMLILSDLTMGNISYDKREYFYNAISDSLMRGGIFVDKILTHPCAHISLKLLDDKYELLPINLIEINNFSCEYFFCSELLSKKQIVDSTAFYDILSRRFDSEKLKIFLENCHKITPEGCIWYYGKHWDELKSNYCSKLNPVDIIEDVRSSPYYERAKLVFLRKG
jgi:hypothetical protein